MPTTLTDLFQDALIARKPLPRAAQARVKAAIDEAIRDGLDDAAAAERVANRLADDADLREAGARRRFEALFAEHALALGAVYSAERDGWQPPAGMTFDALGDAVIERLRQRYGIA